MFQSLVLALELCPQMPSALVHLRNPEAPPRPQHRFGLHLAKPVNSGDALSYPQKRKKTRQQRGRWIGKGQAHGRALPAQGPAPASS